MIFLYFFYFFFIFCCILRLPKLFPLLIHFPLNQFHFNSYLPLAQWSSEWQVPRGCTINRVRNKSISAVGQCLLLLTQISYPSFGPSSSQSVSVSPKSVSALSSSQLASQSVMQLVSQVNHSGELQWKLCSECVDIWIWIVTRRRKWRK